jgi:hypothetical protein
MSFYARNCTRNPQPSLTLPRLTMSYALPTGKSSALCCDSFPNIDMASFWRQMFDFSGSTTLGNAVVDAHFHLYQFLLEALHQAVLRFCCFPTISVPSAFVMLLPTMFFRNIGPSGRIKCVTVIRFGTHSASTCTLLAKLPQTCLFN